MCRKLLDSGLLEECRLLPGFHEFLGRAELGNGVLLLVSLHLGQLVLWHNDKLRV